MWFDYEYECACVECGKYESEDGKPTLHKCKHHDDCPRFHDFCVKDACGACQWCASTPTHSFSAKAVDKARCFAESLKEGDRKTRALSFVEYHEKSVPPEAVPSPTKISVESGGDSPVSPPHSDKTTSGGQPAPLDAQPSAKEDDANSKGPKTCAQGKVFTGQLVVYKGQLGHIRQITNGTLLLLAMEDSEALGGARLGCVDVQGSDLLEVSAEECHFPEELPQATNRQGTDYGVPNWMVLGQTASFRRRSNSVDVCFGTKVRIMGSWCFFRL